MIDIKSTGKTPIKIVLVAAKSKEGIIMVFCPYCAEEIDDKALRCKHCGAILMGEAHDGGVGGDSSAKKKSPGMAAALSIVVPGAGHIYNGRFESGLMLILIAVLSGIISAKSQHTTTTLLLVYAYGVISSYLIAKGINANKIRQLMQNRNKVGLAGCPNCGAVFVYVTGIKKVTCPSCDYTTVIQANVHESSLI